MTDTVNKATFLAGLRCPTQGWREHRAERAAIGAGLEWQFHVGQEIGRLARRQLSDGEVRFEAPFEWRGCVARADAIRPQGDGWDLIEVKSGKEPEDGDINPEYIDDAAYTTMVALGAGFSVRRCFLMLIRRDLRLGDTGDPLVEVEVTEAVLKRAAEFAEVAGEVVGAVLGEAMPAPELVFACRDCEYFATECIGRGVPDPLFVLPRLSQKKFALLREYGRISALPDAIELPETQERVARVVRSGVPERDLVALARLDDVVWPAHYLDFEAVMPALPWFPDTPPHESIPFQYSIHVAEAPDGTATHREYLAPFEGDWRRELAERLLNDMGGSGSVVTYSGYEKRMLNTLARMFPDLDGGFGGVIARLFDLEKVVNKGYCHPGFMGRTSIKRVLPVVAPALSYASLRVGNGEDAMGTFGLLRVGRRAPEEHAGLRAALLEYCKLDTAAMVAVHRALLGVRRSV
jgi:hypothetical protein